MSGHLEHFDYTQPGWYTRLPQQQHTGTLLKQECRKKVARVIDRQQRMLASKLGKR